MSWPFHSQGESPQYPLDKRLGGLGPRVGLDVVVKRKMPITAPAF